MPVKWIANPRQVYPRGYRNSVLRNAQRKFDIVASYSGEIEQWMRDNAVWQDRTGEARQALNVKVNKLKDRIEFVFAHGVDYGKYLEDHNDSRFAILRKTIDHWGPVIMRRIAR